MLRSHKQPPLDDDWADDDDDERHGSIELKDILKRKLPTSTEDDDYDDSTTTDDDSASHTTADTADGSTAAADDNHIGRLTPNYRNTHRHRKAIPRKTAALAIFLTLVGVGFLCLGVSFWFTRDGSLRESVPFLVLGGLSFIPGSFHVVILYLAYTGQYGWTYDHVPTYERQ